MSGTVLMLVCARPAGPLPRPGLERRTDYRLVREALDAELIDLTTVDRSRLARPLQRGGGKYVALALLGFLRVLRGGVDVVLCDNENEAMVLAVLLTAVRRRVPVVTLAIAPGAAKKALFFRLPWARDRIRLWLAHASLHADVLVEQHGVQRERVQVLPFHADHLFFDPDAVDPATAPRPTPRPYLLAIGRQHRDYPTLLAAAEGLPVDVVIDAGSQYSRSPDELTGRPLPPTVHLVTLDQEQLRAAYALAEVVVAPTHENDFGAGSTTLLEAMAMNRPVVTTRGTGSGDLVGDRRAALRADISRDTRGTFAARFAATSAEAQGPHGLHVPVGDVAALRGALTRLLEDPAWAQDLGRRGRALVVDGLSTDHFVQRVVTAVQPFLPAPAGSTSTAAG